MKPPFLIGSEVQWYEQQTRATGIQRVIRTAHVALSEGLQPDRMQVVPMHTRDLPRVEGFHADPYLAADPVLAQTPRSIHDVDMALLLDLNPAIDYRTLLVAREQRDIPMIAMIYDILPILHREWFPEANQRHFRVFLQGVLAVSDRVIVTSNKVRDDIEQLNWRIRGQMDVIPLGSSFGSLTPPRFDDDRIAMLYVSTVAPHKGHDLLLTAFDLLLADGHDVSLTLIGGLGGASDVAAPIRTHPALRGRLRWLPNADDTQLRSIARSCNLAVLPTAHEGFGIFLEEGLALGLKAVVSDLRVFRERAQPNVFFAQRTPEALATTILHAHRTPWDSSAPPVRTMTDFGDDLTSLVREVAEQR